MTEKNELRVPQERCTLGRRGVALRARLDCKAEGGLRLNTAEDQTGEQVRADKSTTPNSIEFGRWPRVDNCLD